MRALALMATIAASVLVAQLAHAAEPGLSRYEQETLQLALDSHPRSIDPQPGNKVIEAIDIEVLDVIEQRDPAPSFLNILHVRSKDYIIRREVLLKVGERYDALLIEESERNLRALRQESVVVIVPLVGSAPDRVRVLVVAKDVWSLRVNWGLKLRGSGIESLTLQPSEENLFGTHRRVNANFLYRPDTLSFGGGFLDRRLAGSRVLAFANANVIVNQETGAAEGTFGQVQYGLPLYSTRQQWAWGGVAAWHHAVTRQFAGLDPVFYDADMTGGKTFTLACTTGTRCIPLIYDTDRISGRFSVTRSFGRDVKQSVSVGIGADRRVFSAPDLSDFDPAAAGEFRRDILPQSDTRNGPFVQYHVYMNRFAEVHDVETIGLKESFVIGPEAYGRFYPVAEAFGSTRNFLGYRGELAYTYAHRGFIGRAYVAGKIEISPSHDNIFDSSVHVGGRLISPSFVIGRLIYDGTFFYRPHNSLRRRLTLGGDTRLRGYLSEEYFGENLLASNLEFRTRAFQLWTVLLAGSLFYDVGDVYDGDELRPKQGAGLGLRLLLPQLNSAVFRIDWGFALTPGVTRATLLDGVVVTFRQAFSMPRPTGVGVRVFNE